MNCGTDGVEGTGFMSCAMAEPGVGGGGGGGGGGTTPFGGCGFRGFPGGGSSGGCWVMRGGLKSSPPC